MNALVDAPLPRRLVYRLCEAGWDAIHTLDLPDGNGTSDAEIIRVADTEDRVAGTKDSDFVGAHVVRGEPRRLLVIATGNLKNRELESALGPRLADLGGLFERGASHVEVTRSLVIVRG